MDAFDLDVLIVGGGVAGLWILDEARRAGFSVLLVEAEALGSGQTIASQGILHGGFKHALGGRAGDFTDALRGITVVWRDCLAGGREPNLQEVRRRAETCFFWRTGGWGSLLTLQAARIGVSAKMTVVPSDRRAAPLAGCPGDVYRLEEQVIDPGSLLCVLFERNASAVVRGSVSRFELADGQVERVAVTASDRTGSIELHPQTVVFAAGAGNLALRRACGLASDQVRHLPLSILVVHGNLPDLNGVCLDKARAKAIVTTHRETADGSAVWQVASETASSPERIFEELLAALPGFDWPEIATETYTAMRAEGMPGGARADDVHVIEEGNVLTAWPAKLVLAPRLAEHILERLPRPAVALPLAAFDRWPRPPVAQYPWDKPHR